jgi:hypothetical protein
MSTPDPSTASAGMPQAPQMQVIYADRILNVGIGPNVSRLTLSLDTDTKTTSPFATLIIPTATLFEFFDSISSSIIDNEAMKEGLVRSLKDFESKLSAKNMA